jgi:hypothetical protein
LKNKLRLILIVLLALSLASCIEVFQYVSVKDGNVSIYLKYVIQKAILEMGSSFSGEEVDYDELLGEGDALVEGLGDLKVGMNLINTDLEAGYEVNIEGTLDQINALSEYETIPFVPEKRGDRFFLAVPGMGSSSNGDEWEAAFLAGSKYRILLDLSGDLAGIRDARLIVEQDDMELEVERDSLITKTVLGQNLLIEIPMLVLFMSEKDITIELF